MADVYSRIAEVDPAVQEQLAGILEVGCGTGWVSRELASLPGVRAVVGVDPTPVFVVRARALPGAERIGKELCAALKAEARRRVAAGRFFGFIGFASFIARRPT